MIRHLTREQIDDARWDACIEEAVNHRIYGYSWYLDLVCESWDGLIEDDYSAVFPLPFRKKYGIRYLFQPDFTQQLGLFCRDEPPPAMVDSFLDAIPKRFWFAEICLNSSAFPAQHQATARNNYELNLEAPYPELSVHYSSNLQRNIRRGIKSGLQVSPHPDTGAIIRMFRENRGATLHRWNERTYQRLSRLFHTLEHRGQARAWGTYSSNNNLVAGALFFFDRKYAVMVFSGLTPEGKESGAMPFLLDHVIREFASTPLILDFEGSMDPGLARFYASFGADIRQYWFLKMNRLPVPLKWLL
jgi:hypothetical protein